MQITTTKDSRSEMFAQVLLPEIEQMFAHPSILLVLLACERVHWCLFYLPLV